MKTVERILIEQLKPLMPGARLERKKDTAGGNHHITIRDISKTNVETVLQQQGLEVRNSDRTHSSRYTGQVVEFNNADVYIVVRTANSRKGGHFVVQKQTAPEKLNLSKTYTDARTLKADAIAGLTLAKVPANVCDALISLLDVADGTSSEFVNTDVLEGDKSFITSDFGEVLGAYTHLVRGASVVEFPESSNNLNIDYVVDGLGVAHKSTNGSSRFTLDASVASSLLALKTNCSHLRVLQSIVSRDRYGIMTNAADNCAELAHWKNLLGGFSTASLSQYVATHSFDEYITEVYASQSGKLGISRKQDQVRAAWEAGSIEPMMFTFLTFMARYYSEKFVDELGTIVRSVIGNNIFEYVDYCTTEHKIKVAQKPYQSYNKWKIHYHGNSISAFNNWPAPVGVEG